MKRELLRHFGHQPELLERIFDNFPDILFYAKDVEGRYVSVNEALVTRSGLRREQVIGKTSDQVFPIQGGPTAISQDLSIIASGTSIINRLRLYSVCRGRQFWCLSSKYPIVDQAGRAVGTIGVSRDLPKPTDRYAGYSRLLQYVTQLEDSIGENQSVTDAAERLGMSIDTLERLTREVFHLNPKQLSMKLRIEQACKLLRETGMNVAGIAAECGYADHSAFTRQFRLATGLTPKQYRQAGLSPSTD